MKQQMKQHGSMLEETMQKVRTAIERYTRWIVLGEIVIIFAVSWFAFLQQQYTNIQDIGVHAYDTAVQERNQQREYLSQLQLMKENYSKVQQERLVRLGEVVPHGFDAPTTISRMQAFADEANVTIKSIDVVRVNNTNTEPSTPLTDSTANTITITMNIALRDADYDGLKQLLKTLETTTPILDMQQLTYSPGTSSFALQLTSYYIDDTSL